MSKADARSFSLKHTSKGGALPADSSRSSSPGTSRAAASVSPSRELPGEFQPGAGSRIDAMRQAGRRCRFEQHARRACRVDDVGRRNRPVFEDSRRAASQQGLQDTGDAALLRPAARRPAEQALDTQDVAARNVEREPLAEQIERSKRCAGSDGRSRVPAPSARPSKPNRCCSAPTSRLRPRPRASALTRRRSRSRRRTGRSSAASTS